MYELFSHRDTKIADTSDSRATFNSYSMASPFELLQINTMGVNESGLFSIFQNSISRTYYGCYNIDDIGIGYIPALLHSHDYYEFLFVVEGEMYQNIENHRHYYPAGGCCLVAPDTMHMEEYSTESRVIFLKISQEYMHTLINAERLFANEASDSLKRVTEFCQSKQAYIDFIPAHEYEWIRENVHSIFEQMVYEFTGPSDSATFKFAMLINSLLQELFDENQFGNTPISYGTHTEQQLFREIRDYMLRSGCKVTRSELEEHFRYSGDYLYKIVKNQTGLSLYNYNVFLCMKRACDMLIDTNMRINDIAEAVGFHNYTHFYKVFYEHYKTTPREYRLQYSGGRRTAPGNYSEPKYT